MTWREVIYDIYTSLGQNFDDGKLTLRHVMYWVSIAGNRLLMQHMDKRDSGAFLTVYSDIPVLIDTNNGYKYIQLPADIIDFDMDGGIEYLSYDGCVDDCTPPFTSVQFTRVSPSAARVLYYTDEEKPRPNNPYFYRVGDRLYLLGLECINVCGTEIGIYQTIVADECNLDDPFPFPDELIAVLQKYVFDLGRWVMTIPNEYVNDGTGELPQGQNIPTSKLISVNQDTIGQPIQQQQQQ